MAGSHGNQRELAGNSGNIYKKNTHTYNLERGSALCAAVGLLSLWEGNSGTFNNRQSNLSS